MEYWFTLVVFGLMVIIISFLITFYAKRKTPIYVIIIAWLGWLLGFSIIAILPQDIYMTKLLNANSINDSEDYNTEIYDSLKIYWYSIYWTTYVMCWVILPILSSYFESGEFTFKGKLWYAIKINLIIYGIGAIFLVAFLIYIAVEKGFKNQSLPGFLIALGNTWGLMQIIFFLGHGLVKVPKYFWNMSQDKNRYKTIICSIAQTKDFMEEGKYRLEDLMQEVQAAHSMTSNDLRVYTEKILEKCPLDDMELLSSAPKRTIFEKSEFFKTEITYKGLVKLNTELNFTLHENEIHHHKYERLLKKAYRLEDQINTKEQKTYPLQYSLKKARNGKFGTFMNGLEYHWFLRIKPICCIIMFFCFLIFAFLIVLGECTLFSDINFALFGMLLNVNLDYFATFFVCLIPLIMLTVCTYHGIFDFKLSKVYGLHSHKQTDASSLIYSALILARLAAPLCYNFLMLYKFDETTQFERVVGMMDVVPIFGSGFQTYFPCVIVLLCIMNFLNVYSKLMKFLGLERFTFVQTVSTENYEEGLRLMERERKKKGSGFGNNTLTHKKSVFNFFTIS